MALSSEALSTSPPPAGLVRLADWGLLHAGGRDTRSFLQGQLTQDMNLPPGQARLAGYCSPKGRLLASFVTWGDGEQDLWLACSADLLAPTLKRLSMFVMRAQCKLRDVSGERPLWGLAGSAGAQALGEQAAAPVWAQARVGEADVLRLPDALVAGQAVPRWLWAGEPPPGVVGLPGLDEATWRWLEAASGVPRITAATVEQFVPQMVNLELVDGVNFKKGCYPGQEVVARSQYRGSIKRRGHLVFAEGPLTPGQELFHSSDPVQPGGLVVNAGHWPGAPAGQAHAALVELKTALAERQEGGSLHAGAADGPLLLPGALPYALPAAEAA